MSALAPFLIAILATVLVLGVSSAFTRSEARIFFASLAAHGLSVIAQVLITTRYYGGGDMLNYFRFGESLARLMRADFDRFFPEVLTLLFQGDAHFPFYVMGVGSTTGTMSAVSALMHFTFGDSLYAHCAAFSTLSLLGKIALYAALRARLEPSLRERVALACLFFPSVVFWSSAILKESLAVAGLGFAVFGFHALERRNFPVASVAGVGGVILVALTKAYILFALGPALVVHWYWTRALVAGGGRVVIRPLALVFAAVAAVGLLVLLGQLFPRYSAERFAEEASYQQQVGAVVGGGSYYEMGNAEARSLAGQLLFAPIALITAFFRPFLFEVQNPPMALAALEMTALTVLAARAALTRSIRWIVGTVQQSPILAASLTFCVLFGVAVGLSTTNMGTLSRYRMPMLPFLGLIVLIWNAPPTRRRSRS